MESIFDKQVTNYIAGLERKLVSYTDQNYTNKLKQFGLTRTLEAQKREYTMEGNAEKKLLEAVSIISI